MTNRSFRLQEDIAAKLAAVVEEEQRSGNWIVNHALREYFEHRDEEQRRWQETLEAIAEADRGEVVSGEKVMEWLESWGKDNELPSPRLNPNS